MYIVLQIKKGIFMRKLITLCLVLGTQIVLGQDFDPNLLTNNKEAKTRQLSKRDHKKLSEWLSVHSLSSAEIKSKAQNALSLTMTEFMNRDAQCDLGLAKILN